MTTIRSPLRYPGGKSRALKSILPLIPDVPIISPFFGGGSVELAIASQRKQPVKGFDVYGPLVAFWQELQSRPKWLAEQAKTYFPLNKEGFYTLQKLHWDDNNPYQAVLFFVLNRSSFSGTTASGGCSDPSQRFTKSSIERIARWIPIEGLTVEQHSFEQTILEAKNEFLFCDPPYLIKSKLYGVRGSTHKNFNHGELANLLKAHNGRFLLCYNDCPEIRDLYSGCHFLSPVWPYGMGTNKKSNEILVMNYEPSQT